MSSLLTLDSSADSEAVGYCHLGEGTLGSHIVSFGKSHRGPAAGNMCPGGSSFFIFPTGDLILTCLSPESAESSEHSSHLLVLRANSRQLTNLDPFWHLIYRTSRVS